MVFETGLPEEWKQAEHYRKAEDFLEEEERELWGNLVEAFSEEEVHIDKLFIEIGLGRRQRLGCPNCLEEN